MLCSFLRLNGKGWDKNIADSSVCMQKWGFMQRKVPATFRSRWRNLAKRWTAVHTVQVTLKQLDKHTELPKPPVGFEKWYWLSFSFVQVASRGRKLGGAHVSHSSFWELKSIHDQGQSGRTPGLLSIGNSWPSKGNSCYLPRTEINLPLLMLAVPPN